MTIFFKKLENYELAREKYPFYHFLQTAIAQSSDDHCSILPTVGFIYLFFSSDLFLTLSPEQFRSLSLSPTLSPDLSLFYSVKLSSNFSSLLIAGMFAGYLFL